MNEATKDLRLDVLPLKKAALVLRAGDHQLRQKILALLHTKGKVAVTEIYCHLRLEQSVASAHLAILRKAGFVTTERVGRFKYYSVNYERVREIQRIARALFN